MEVRKTRWKVVAAILGLAVPVGFLVWLGAKAFGIYTVTQEVASKEATRLEAQSSALQALSAIAGVTVALVLAVITFWYARLTKGILEKTGPIVSVEMGIAWYMDEHSSTSFVVMPFDSPAPSSTPKYTKRKMLATVLNAGNGSVMIVGLKLRHSSGIWYIATDPVFGDHLPHKLEGNSAAHYFIELDWLLQVVSALKDETPGTVHAEVELGNGQKVCSKEELARISNSE